MLDPKASEAEDGASQANVASSFAKFQEKQKWRALQRKYDMDGGGDNPDMPPGDDEVCLCVCVLCLYLRACLLPVSVCVCAGACVCAYETLTWVKRSFRCCGASTHA